MERSTNFGFYLPSRDGEDIADINQISENFRIIDNELVADQSLNESSTRAISNKAVTEETDRLFRIISGSTYELNEEIVALGLRLNDVENTATNAISGASEAHIRLDAVEAQIGDVETALDSIIAIQNGLIGGASV